MGKKYFDTKEGTLESSVLNVWAEAAKKSESMDKVNPKALKKDFDDRKDKDIDNDGDVDDSDEYLHNRRKTVAKAVKKEGLEDKTDNPANSQHMCAKNVVHEEWGAGQPIHGQHADPDENGEIAWYDVMFEHGIEKGVSINELKVTKAEAHMHASYNAKKKKDEEVEVDERMKLPRQLIDKNKEVMIVKNNKVMVVDKKDQDKYMKQGWSLAEETELDEKVEYVEYKFRNKNDAMKAKAMLDAVQLMSFDVEDDDISNGELRVDAGNKDMTKYHKEIMKKFRPKVMTQEKVDESYEIGTDEYRDHALDLTPGQHLTWGSANAYKQASMKEALAKVWGLEEKVLDKSEEDDKIAPVKGKKSMTGGKVADIDVDPEMKDEK